MPILEEKIKNLNIETAPGTDKVHNIFLKKMGTAGKEILVSIINQVNLQDYVPKLWRTSITAMLYKSEDKADLLNYRPITLLSCAYKIYSSIQTDRLNKWIEENKILNDNRFGFCAGGDTADTAARLFACISNSITLKMNLHAIFLDIAKAYDLVQHWALQQTLTAYGMVERDVNLLMAMIVDCYTQLLTADGPMDLIRVLSGVRQGDGISPILYALFLNPLLEWMEKEGLDPYKIGSDFFPVGTYADNMTLVSQSTKGITHNMGMVEKFMVHNDIKINCKKSSYHWQSLCKAEISVQGEKLKEESSDSWFTYLGWTTNLELDWDNQIDNLIEKYQNTVKLLMSEKGLMIDQKIRTIEAIAVSTIVYRTKLMYSLNNLWLKLLDKWTIKNLNWLGKQLPWETDPAYWYGF